MQKKSKHQKKSAMDVVSATSNSVHNGLESIKSAVNRVVSKAEKINNDVAAKAKTVASDLTHKIK